MEEGKLKQTPVRELEKYWENEIIYKRVKVNGTAFLKGISGRVFDLTLTNQRYALRCSGNQISKKGTEIYPYCVRSGT